MQPGISDKRHAAITELATRILTLAKEAYDRAPKLVLDGSESNPPPIEWHVAFTASQLLELFLRVCVLRKIQSTPATLENPWPPFFDQHLEKTITEAKRALKIFNIELAQEI